MFLKPWQFLTWRGGETYISKTSTLLFPHPPLQKREIAKVSEILHISSPNKNFSFLRVTISYDWQLGTKNSADSIISDHCASCCTLLPSNLGPSHVVQESIIKYTKSSYGSPMLTFIPTGNSFHLHFLYELHFNSVGTKALIH